MSAPRSAAARRAIVPLTALALALAGCTSSDGASGGSALSYEDSPLAAYFDGGMAGMSQEERDREYVEISRKTEELVAACMKEEGFEYTPTVYDPSDQAAAEYEWEPDKREWVEQYGYGVMNDPFTESAGETTTEYTDANTEYTDSLSESERAAYMDALYGPIVDDTEGESVEYDWKTAGCYGAAQHEVSGEDISTDEQFAELFERITTFWEDVPEAPEFQALDAAWAECMEAAGESGFTRQSDAQNSISAARAALEPEQPQGEKAGEATDGAADASSAEVFHELRTTPEGKELAEREVELALIDLDCREKNDYMQESLRIQFELEEQFIGENKAELDAYKAAAAQAG